MHKNFREHHLLKIFELFDQTDAPLDLCISRYFKANKSLGSKDRKTISEKVYHLIRWKGLIDHFCPKPIHWGSRLETLNQLDFSALLQDTSIPLHIRASFPKNLFDTLNRSLGEKTFEYCLESNKQAPIFLRANTLKTTREELLDKWQGQYSCSPTLKSPFGIVFHKRENFAAFQEFKEGLFEVQDEGSQLVAALVKAKPGDQVFDYCSGSGGKSLAIAAAMQNKGQLFLHDIRPQALVEAKKRLKRAGVQNAQILLSKAPNLKLLKGKMDWLLLDVPCSGTGTYRRNPDLKWKFDDALVSRLVQEQRTIFEESLIYLKPKGKIVYATCSVLKDENEEQIAYFQEKFGAKLEHPPFSSLPKEGAMDGFFGAVLSF